jgi:uncharacterized phage protein (TIGR01671 family)
MREILFRGKRIYEDEWVEGSLICFADGCYFVCVQGENMDFMDKFGVIPETVGQYTGLLDKNGKKVFDGDIVEAYNLLGESEGIGVVRWSDTFAGWHISKTKSMYCANIMSYKIIGNVFDTPELVEVK